MEKMLLPMSVIGRKGLGDMEVVGSQGMVRACCCLLHIRDNTSSYFLPTFSMILWWIGGNFYDAKALNKKFRFLSGQKNIYGISFYYLSVPN